MACEIGEGLSPGERGFQGRYDHPPACAWVAKKEDVDARARPPAIPGMTRGAASKRRYGRAAPPQRTAWAAAGGSAFMPDSLAIDEDMLNAGGLLDRLFEAGAVDDGLGIEDGHVGEGTVA